MKQRVCPQLLVIIDVFITERQTIDPLCQHLPDGMLDPMLLPPIEKTGGEPRQQVQALFSLPQQQTPGIGGDRPAIKAGHNLSSSTPFKPETRLDTLCHKQK